MNRAVSIVAVFAMFIAVAGCGSSDSAPPIQQTRGRTQSIRCAAVERGPACVDPQGSRAADGSRAKPLPRVGRDVRCLGGVLGRGDDLPGRPGDERLRLPDGWLRHGRRSAARARGGDQLRRLPDHPSPFLGVPRREHDAAATRCVDGHARLRHGGYLDRRGVGIGGSRRQPHRRVLHRLWSAGWRERGERLPQRALPAGQSADRAAEAGQPDHRGPRPLAADRARAIRGPGGQRLQLEPTGAVAGVGRRAAVRADRGRPHDVLPGRLRLQRLPRPGPAAARARHGRGHLQVGASRSWRSGPAISTRRTA